MLLAHMREHGMSERLEVPEIPAIPAHAITMLCERIEASREHYVPALVGSSLGGYYATWLAERYGCAAVLVNPAVRPYDLLEEHLGEYTNYYTSESWVLDESHIEQLRELEVTRVTKPHRYLLMLQTGDEILDYRLAQQKYLECPSIIEQGGDHGFSGFEEHIETVLTFCGIESII